MWLHSYCDLASFQGSWRTGKQDQGPRLPGRRAKPRSLGAGPWVSSPTEGQPSPRTSGNTAADFSPEEPVSPNRCVSRRPGSPSRALGPCCYNPKV